MKKSQEQRKKTDSKASSGKHGPESVSIDHEHWTKDLAWILEEGEAKDQRHECSSGNVEAEGSTMSQEQIDLAHELCRERVSFADIKQMMGVSEGSVTRFELMRVLMDAEILIIESLNTQGEYIFEKLEAEIRTEKLRRKGTRPDSVPGQRSNF